MSKAVESQQVNEYSNLVHHVIHKYYQHYPPEFEYEDLVQIGTLGLLKAIRKDIPGKGHFVSFAICVIKNAIYDALYKSLRDKRNRAVLSLNVTNETGHELMDIVADREAVQEFDSVDEMILWNKIIEDATAEERKIIHLLAQQKKTGEIAKQLGISQKNARQLIASLKTKICALMGRSEPVTTRRAVKPADIDSSPVNTALDLSEFIIFNASNSTGNRECYAITISKAGKVKLSAAVGAKYQTGTKLEVLVNKKCNIIIVRPSDNGISCRPNGGQTQGKQISCKALLRHLEPLKMSLPLRFKAEFDAKLNGWVGRK